MQCLSGSLAGPQTESVLLDHWRIHSGRLKVVGCALVLIETFCFSRIVHLDANIYFHIGDAVKVGPRC